MSVGGRESIKDPKELHEKLKSRNYDGLDINMAIMEDQGHTTMIIQGFITGLRTVFGR